MEMRDEVFSSVGAQDVDTSGFQVSDLGKVGFKWENDQLDVDTVFRPGIDNVFSPTAFDDLEIGGAAEKPILFDKKGQRELSSKNTSLWDTKTTLCFAEESSIWNNNRNCSWLCLQKIVSISITV